MKQHYLAAEQIVKYMRKLDDTLETMIFCETNTHFVTTDQSLYEALGSLDEETFDYRRLVKLLEVVDVVSFSQSLKKKRQILTPERVKQLQIV